MQCTRLSVHLIFAKFFDRRLWDQMPNVRYLCSGPESEGYGISILQDRQQTLSGQGLAPIPATPGPLPRGPPLQDYSTVIIPQTPLRRLGTQPAGILQPCLQDSWGSACSKHVQADLTISNAQASRHIHVRSVWWEIAGSAMGCKHAISLALVVCLCLTCACANAASRGSGEQNSRRTRGLLQCCQSPDTDCSKTGTASYPAQINKTLSPWVCQLAFHCLLSKIILYTTTSKLYIFCTREGMYFQPLLDHVVKYKIDLEADLSLQCSSRGSASCKKSWMHWI